MIEALLDFILHIDVHLNSLIQEYGILVYIILFLIIFLETGLVVTPFLPGDSLLFAAGAFAALGSLNLFLLLITLIAAAILGDTANYWIGNKIGIRIFEKTRLVKKEHLERAEEFYEKHGGKTIVLARFIPIIRTFAPFAAGVGKMKYFSFLSYNVIGGVAWVLIFTLGGFWFGNLPAVRENFTFVILAIIVISFVPAVIGYLRHRKK